LTPTIARLPPRRRRSIRAGASSAALVTPRRASGSLSPPRASRARARTPLASLTTMARLALRFALAAALVAVLLGGSVAQSDDPAPTPAHLIVHKVRTARDRARAEPRASTEPAAVLIASPIASRAPASRLDTVPGDWIHRSSVVDPRDRRPAARGTRSRSEIRFRSRSKPPIPSPRRSPRSLARPLPRPPPCHPSPPTL
jgi:hypothetical protein